MTRSRFASTTRPSAHLDLQTDPHPPPGRCSGGRPHDGDVAGGAGFLCSDIPGRGRRWSAGDRSDRRCGRERATGSTPPCCGVLSLRHFRLARWCSLSLGGWWPRIRRGASRPELRELWAAQLPALPYPKRQRRPFHFDISASIRRLDQINANTTRTKFVRLRQNPIFAIHFASMVTGKPSPYPAATVFSSWPRIAHRTSCGQPAARNRSCAR